MTAVTIAQDPALQHIPLVHSATTVALHSVTEVALLSYYHAWAFPIGWNLNLLFVEYTHNVDGGGDEY